MFCATDIIAISESLKDKIVELGLEKRTYYSSWSWKLEWYRFDNFTKNNNSIPQQLKEKLDNHFVIGYVGRIVRDKGIHEVIKHLN